MTSPTPTGRPGNRSIVETDRKATNAAITGTKLFLCIGVQHSLTNDQRPRLVTTQVDLKAPATSAASMP